MWYANREKTTDRPIHALKRFCFYVYLVEINKSHHKYRFYTKQTREESLLSLKSVYNYRSCRKGNFMLLSVCSDMTPVVKK